MTDKMSATSKGIDKQCLYFGITVGAQHVFCIFMLSYISICQGSYFDPLLSSNEIPLELLFIIYLIIFSHFKITSSFLDQHINPHLLLYRLKTNHGSNI